jgi:hypothetical protein
MSKAVAVLLAAAIVANAADVRAAPPSSIKDLEDMPAKQVFEYCAPFGSAGTALLASTRPSDRTRPRDVFSILASCS